MYIIFRIEERLDFLKSSLKRGILGMDKVLRGIKGAQCEAAGDCRDINKSVDNTSIPPVTVNTE